MVVSASTFDRGCICRNHGFGYMFIFHVLSYLCVDDLQCWGGGGGVTEWVYVLNHKTITVFKWLLGMSTPPFEHKQVIFK
jgi:hypothetical protein